MGSIDDVTLARIKRRFAGREAAVECAFATRPSFRGLCRDYIACANALTRWREAQSEDAPLRAAEYSELLDELTQEIEAHLGAKVH